MAGGVRARQGRLPPSGGAGDRRPLNAVLGTYREAEATRWGHLVLGNVWPAYLFALPLGIKLWGLRDRLLAPGTGELSRVYAQIAQEVVTVLFLALVVVLFIIRRRPVGRRADGRDTLVALAGTFLLNVVGLLPVPHETTTEALLGSTVVIVAGTLFTTLSLAFLGRCFGLLPEARGLVTRGPYRWVRHPVYLGEMVSALGIAVAKPHWAVLVLYAAFVGLQLWRARLEERALASAFPLEYPAYRARTATLLPRWR